MIRTFRNIDTGLSSWLHFWGLSASCSLLVFIALITLASSGILNGVSVVHADEIRVLDAPNYSGTRQPNPDDPEFYADDVNPIPSSLPRQYSAPYPLPFLRDAAVFGYGLQSPATVWVNGAPQGETTVFSNPFPGLSQELIHVPINEVLLNQGENRVTVRLEAGENKEGIQSLFFGAELDIEIMAEHLDRVGQIINRLSLVGVILSLPLALSLWLIGRDKSLTILGSALAIYFTLIITWSAIDTVPGLLIAEKALALGICTVGLSYKSLGHSSRFLFTLVVFVALYSILIGTISYVINPREPLALSLSVVSQLSLIVSLFFIPPFLAVVKIAEFQSILRSTQSEAEVTGKALQQTESRLREEIANAAVLKERQRFTRDVHDGIGGQLLSLLLKVRSGRASYKDIEYNLQSGLNDLRLVVDSLDHVGDDFGGALTTFKARADAQLSAENISFDWFQDEELKGIEMDTRRILQIYRFLQEVISNVSRHAEADEMKVRIEVTPDRKRVVIQAEDNGKGFDVECQPPGRGLRSLRERADKLSGEYEILSSEAGTHIRLSVPIQGKVFSDDYQFEQP